MNCPKCNAPAYVGLAVVDEMFKCHQDVMDQAIRRWNFEGKHKCQD